MSQERDVSEAITILSYCVEIKKSLRSLRPAERVLKVILGQPVIQSLYSGFGIAFGGGIREFEW